ncbi:MAG TPA: hypothetical protein VLC10_00380, partial [Patescibacteria group bacterium]|nr:hypothetical protein [Patescibacteria group bacterium]
LRRRVRRRRRRFLVSMAWTLLFTIPLFLLPVGYFVWLRVIFARPPVTGRAVVAEYDPPADVSPIEAALLLDGTLKPRALAAAMVGLHLKGAIDVAESHGTVAALRRGAADVEFPPHEKIILAALFGDEDIVTADEAAERVDAVVKIIEAAVLSDLRRKGFVAERSPSAMILFASAAMSALMISLAILPAFGLRGSVGLFGALVLLAELGYIAATWRPRLTGRGREATLRLMGFKEWFTQVEADNERWMMKEEKRLTDYAPYAIVFGTNPTWATKLQAITRALLKNII